MEEKSLKDNLADVASKLDMLIEQKKVKKWVMPISTRIGMGKKKKRQGWVVFMNVGTNKALTFIKAPISDNVAIVNGVPHVIEPEDILLWKNRLPVVIQPQWSERPFSTKDHFKSTIQAGQHTAGWEYIINYILKTQVQAKKSIPSFMWLIILLAVIGLGYYLIKSGAFSKATGAG